MGGEDSFFQNNACLFVSVLGCLVIFHCLVPITQDTYSVTLHTIGSGQIVMTFNGAPAPLTGFTYGDVVTVTAVPDPGHKFDGWEVNVTGITTTQSLFMDGNKDIVAQFSPIPYTLNVDAQGNGSILVDPAQDSYGYGDVITATAVPSTSHIFLGWGGDLSGTVTISSTLVMDDDKSVIATFIPNTFTPTLFISDTVTLTWADAEPGCTYDMYGSSQPYSGFVVRGDGNDLLVNIYDIAADVGNPASNTYYYVSVDACLPGVTYYPSNRVGEFSFAIVPGN